MTGSQWVLDLADEVERQTVWLYRVRWWVDEWEGCRSGALDNVVDDRHVHADVPEDLPRSTVYDLVKDQLLPAPFIRASNDQMNEFSIDQ